MCPNLGRILYAQFERKETTMKRKIIQAVSLLMVILLAAGSFPAALATGTEPTEEITAPKVTESPPVTDPAAVPDETQAETSLSETIPDIQSTEPTMTLTEHLEGILSQDSALDVVYNTMSVGECSSDPVTTYAITECDYAQRGVVYTDGSVSFTYNGSNYTHTDMVLHGVDYEGSYRVAYCIEPGTVIGSSPGYSSEEYTGTDAWGRLGVTKQYAVGLAMLYGAPDSAYPQSLSNGDKMTELAHQIGTAIIIHEICLGWRSATPPYNCTNSSYINAFDDEELLLQTDFYWYLDYETMPNAAVMDAYNHISAQLVKHDTIPSFTAAAKDYAPTWELTKQSDGTYAVTLEDTNRILSEYDFSSCNTETLTFTKDGNKLKIVSTSATIPTTAFAPAKTVPSASRTSFFIWLSSDGYDQELGSVEAENILNDPVPAYFKLRLGTGSAKIQKTTEDNKNLSGWQFNIYSDKKCTTKISGPHTTDSKGFITAEDLPVGKVYVKEIGHTNATINAQYTCASTNTQEVTIESGKTVTVKFENKLAYGSIVFKKATDTGAGVELGWTAKLWKVESNGTETYIGSGTTKKSKTDPTYTFTNLLPGKYVLREDTSKGHEGYGIDTTAHNVTVTAGKTETVTVTNTQLGKGKITKAMPDGGSTACWTFEVYRKSDNAKIGSYTTGTDGTFTTEYLVPGDYLVHEIIPEDSLYYCESTNPQTVTVKAGKTASVTFTNRVKPGSISIQKVDPYGNALAGAEFLLEWSEDGTNWEAVSANDTAYVTKGGCTTSGLTDGRLVSPDSGLVTFTGLHPLLQYRLTETDAPDGFQLLGGIAYEGGLSTENALTVTLTVVNAPVFELPATGSNALTLMSVGIALCAALCMSVLLFHKRKENSQVNTPYRSRDHPNTKSIPVYKFLFFLPYQQSKSHFKKKGNPL